MRSRHRETIGDTDLLCYREVRRRAVLDFSSRIVTRTCHHEAMVGHTSPNSHHMVIWDAARLIPRSRNERSG